MKALTTSPLMRRMAQEPRALAIAPQRHPQYRDPSHYLGPDGRPARPAEEPKWKRVGQRALHQGIRAAEASGMAATLGYAYGRWGDPDGKGLLVKIPLDLVTGFAFEIGAAWTENDQAAQHLEAFALGALSLHAGAWGRARGHEDCRAAEGKATAGGLLGEVGARSPESARPH